MGGVERDTINTDRSNNAALVLAVDEATLTMMLERIPHEKRKTDNGYQVHIPAVRGRFWRLKLSATTITVRVDEGTATFEPRRSYYLPGGDGYRAELDENLTSSGPRHWWSTLAEADAGMRVDGSPQH